MYPDGNGLGHCRGNAFVDERRTLNLIVDARAIVNLDGSYFW